MVVPGSHSPSARKQENGTGVDITLDAVKMHLKSVTDNDVIANCSLALSNIATCCGTSRDFVAIGNLATQRGFKRAFSQCGVFAAVIQGMRNMLEVQKAQISGYRALLNLAYDEENKRLIFEDGGTDLILSSMQQHAGSTRVHMFGCLELHQMIFKNETALCVPAQQILAQA
ncbi:hypothetical protein GUITHDRAFT_147256 [Guillardia theta CCMP2712]|uniref:Armadillo repeat-containing domain-containing protein n=1 Tax=Guillardia theta (strain CCMP2712) TaxID=905079 RepID=L1IEZ8_GUITC|nr:hypothetical protein GUITHDRAFT_147256 [Guillardia theta CCMP2712]EKX34425.1 hypothetical protein GUITHDRAFT_147256 [Guillardia theta CCMP2712]|eukprot:XP_005821405.1 hypothetical protein GUITHDRAFT_147256 [Guillardia theta CCMP2712]